MCTLVPQTWDEHIRVFAAWPPLFGLPVGCSARSPPLRSGRPPSRMLAAPEHRREAGERCGPRSSGGRLRPRPAARLAGRLTCRSWRSREPGPSPRSAAPKGQPFPLEGKDLSEVWLCCRLRTERGALFAVSCRARWLNDQRVLRVGSSLVSALFSEGPFSTAISC